MLSSRIISRRHLNDISSDDIQTVQAADDGAEFARAPASCLGRACCRGKGRIEGVDVDGDVDGVSSYSLADSFDDAVGACICILANFQPSYPV